MKLGFALPTAGGWATVGNLTTVARRAEELGYESLWTFQRLLYPVEPVNDYPAAPGQPWPAPFRSALDPLTTLGFVAHATERIRLGIALVNLPFYPPVLLAKQIATLDVLSGGRVDLGAGLGWSRDEYAAVGVPFERRGARADEFLRCLHAIWGPEPARFDGEFYTLPPSYVHPRPVQSPHPPILVGGYADATIRRAAERGDGYLGGNVPLSDIAPLIARLGDAAAAAGRDPTSLRLVSRGAVRLFDTPQGPDRRPLWGSLDEVREDIDRYAQAGLTELFLELNFDPGIGGPDSDPDAARALALHLLDNLAPR